MSTPEVQETYIRTTIIKKILEKMPYERLTKIKTLELVEGLSGFMSAIYKLEIETEHTGFDNRKMNHDVIIKFMKGDENFRKFGRCYIQFPNEVFIYNTVIPYYERVASESPKCTINAFKWIPTVYCADYGNIEGLSSGSPESVLVLDNLAPLGYRNGPRLHLDRDHLKLMTKLIAEFHSFTYALRIRGDVHLENLIGGIIPFPFTTEQGRNLYEAVYIPAFERFFQYVSQEAYKIRDKPLLKHIEKFRRKYEGKPLELLERFREVDEVFSVILHGDFNRNNVLFQYDQKEGFDKPKDVKMIDFQELRYGSPAIDLAFFMYMNMDPSIRDEYWMELLRYYHSTLIASICNILGFEHAGEHESLKAYSFDNFYDHFSKFAFYGVLVCIHFIPWIACSEKECAWIAKHFQRDMFSEKFKEAARSVGGSDANEIILGIVQHASDHGYMDIFD